jgi:hypothetical protein
MNPPRIRLPNGCGVQGGGKPGEQVAQGLKPALILRIHGTTEIVFFQNINLSRGSLQRFPSIRIDMSLIENAAQGSYGDLVFSGDNCGIDDRSLAPRELYVATFL